MDIKTPTTIDEQIEKLKVRGCIIEDYYSAYLFLQQINYYRLSAYFLPFRTGNGTYSNNLHFTRIMDIYGFDRKLRSLILPVIEEIEIMFRTFLAYRHSHEYGALGYKDPKNFNSKHRHQNFLDQIEKDITSNRKMAFVKHHVEHYNGDFPMWVLIEIFTYGQLSRFYSDMHLKDRKSISSNFFTHPQYIQSWLRCLTDLRNRCAHYSRLYYYIFPSQPKTPKNSKYQMGSQLFDYLLVLYYLYPNRCARQTGFYPQLCALIEQYQESIDMKHIGFPENWDKLLSS